MVKKRETSFEQKVSHKTTDYDSLKRSLCEKSYYESLIFYFGCELWHGYDIIKSDIQGSHSD